MLATPVAFEARTLSGPPRGVAPGLLIPIGMMTTGTVRSLRSLTERPTRTLGSRPRPASAGQATPAFESVLAMPDAAARNVLITRTYHELSRQMAAALRTPSLINWCTMAAWASRRAGQSIRGEDLLGQRLLTELLRWACQARTVLARPLEVLVEVAENVARQVGEGNREVFAEVAPAYIGYLQALPAGAPASPAPGSEPARRLRAFFAGFVPGPAARGGQDELRRAFDLYHAARGASCPKRQAELVYAANLYVALQEQTRLQHRIAASLPRGAEALITRRLLSLDLGGTVTHRLGADLPPWPFGQHLRTIEDPELRALILRFDRDIDTTRGSAARRWDRLDERMRFIVDLFRLHASDLRLFREPHCC